MSPSEHTLLVADYKALEVCILGDLCLRLFNDGQLAGTVMPGAPDIHALNAKYVFGDFLKWTIPHTIRVEGAEVLCPYAGELVSAIPTAEFKKHPFGAVLRDMIKTVFYGFAYGKRGFGFATLAGPDGKMIGEQRGDDLVQGLLQAMPALAKLERWVEDYVDEWHGIYSLGGRWCDLREEMESGDDWQRKRAIRRALNFPCQATGAEIIGEAMVNVAGDVELTATGFKTVLQVHDELVLRGPLANVERAKELVVANMVRATANGTALLVPLQVSAGHGPNYFEAK